MAINHSRNMTGRPTNQPTNKNTRTNCLQKAGDQRTVHRLGKRIDLWTKENSGLGEKHRQTLGQGEQPTQRIDTNGSCQIVDDKLANKGKSLPEIPLDN